jgi:hypothetical protein
MSDSHDIAPQITEANEKAPTPVQNTNHVPGEHINPGR